MSGDETRCVSTRELLDQAWEYLQDAKQAGDDAMVLKWLEAIDCLLDRMLEGR